MFHTTGIMLSKHNIANVSGLCNEIKQMDDIKEQISIENTFICFQDKKNNYIVLYYDNKHTESLNICDNYSKTQCINLLP